MQIEISQKYHDWRIGGEFLTEINAFANRLKIARLEEDIYKMEITLYARRTITLIRKRNLRLTTRLLAKLRAI